MRRLTASEALAALRQQFPERIRLYAPGCSGEALHFVEAFQLEPRLADGVTFSGVWIPGVNRTDYADLSPDARSELIFLSPDYRAGFENGRATFLPLSYVQAWEWLATTPLDAAIVQTTAPDARGFVSLGPSVDFSPAVLQRTGVMKVAHVNPAMPRPASSPAYPLDAFEIVCETPRALLRYEQGASTPAFDAIAANVASLVSDDDTLQFGLGNVQFSLLRAIAAKRNLKIHSGMVSDPVLDAIDAGAIAKSDGAITTGVALGGDRLYARAAEDRRFRFMPVGFTHAQSTLAAIPRFVAVNSAIEVDLFGQANAEYLGGRQISGAGGIVDYLRGAAASEGGKPIVALVSTAKGGAVSRIVPKLSGPTVSIARADIGFVVTEHGVAELRGRSIDDRARALIEIADPRFRSELGLAWAAIRDAL
jgi:acyl-CoA hydrolase